MISYWFSNIIHNFVGQEKEKLMHLSIRIRSQYTTLANCLMHQNPKLVNLLNWAWNLQQLGLIPGDTPPSSVPFKGTGDLHLSQDCNISLEETLFFFEIRITYSSSSSNSNFEIKIIYSSSSSIVSQAPGDLKVLGRGVGATEA